MGMEEALAMASQTIKKTIPKKGGKNTGRKRTILWEKQNGKCFYCGLDVLKHKLSVDHYWPKYKGGTNFIDNLVGACRACNEQKGNEDPNIFIHGRWLEDRIALINTVVNQCKKA
jgi:5-methylcytosine-specific restriction endonuclease McrA